MTPTETSTPTMAAVVQDTYGTPEVLDLRQVAMPSIGDTDVLIRVAAAGVNPADWVVMNGLPYIARPVYGLRKPKEPIRGTDVAGTVEAVGPDVTRFAPGDEVFGTARGSFAQYAAASEDRLASKPATLDFEQAAAVPMAGLVALQALHITVRSEPASGCSSTAHPEVSVISPSRSRPRSAPTSPASAAPGTRSW